MTAALALVADPAPVSPSPTLRRTLDASTLNAAANHPEVFPWLGVEGEPGSLDLSGLTANPANVALVTEYGGFLVQKVAPAAYEVHSMFPPEGRRGLSKATADGLRYMFTATDALTIRTKVPACNAPAAALAKASGFREVFSRDAAWLAPDGSRCAVSYQEVTFDEWRSLDATLVADGEWFHERLEAAKAARGSALPVHPHDESHERAVGAAVQMLRAGNAEKAVWLYNSWAAFAGYAPLQLLAMQPVIIDAGDAVIEVRNSDMEVLLCR